MGQSSLGNEISECNTDNYYEEDKDQNHSVFFGKSSVERVNEGCIFQTHQIVFQHCNKTHLSVRNDRTQLLSIEIDYARKNRVMECTIT